jgi:dihydropteroate synthase
MTQLVGILNLTPDSFSGDGMQETGAVLRRIDAMMEHGASVIDIGAESTRPGATILAPEEEWRRLEPVALALGKRRESLHFSVDTRHAEVARRALAAGFDWINDVSGGADPDMLPLAAETGCMLVLMHSLSIPADPARTLLSPDPMDEVLIWADRSLVQAEMAGIERAHIVLDPGIGFGKAREQSLALIKDIARLKALGAPVMVGHSRKSFLSLFTDKPSGARDPETLAVSWHLAALQVDYLRVHDVKSHRAMLNIQAAL